MDLSAFGLSDVGRVRTRNEDAFVVRSDIRLFAVADGMGGHAAGDVASKVALTALSNSLTIEPDPELLSKAVELANLTVHEMAAAEPDKAGMGCTLTALLLSDERTKATVAHVGDSRCYLLRDGALVQLTNDHTIAPRSNVLTRAIGTHASVLVDVVQSDVQPGDSFLLCSDGLTGMVSDADLQAMLGQEEPLQKIANDLIEAANLRGGLDNITVVLVSIGGHEHT